MTLQYFPLAVLLSCNTAYAGKTEPHAVQKAPVVTEEDLDAESKVSDFLAALSQYTTLTEEIAELQNKIAETQQKTEAAKDERKQEIAKLRQAYGSQEEPAAEQLPVSVPATYSQTPQNSVFFVDSSPDKKPAAGQIVTLDDIFDGSPVQFTTSNGKTYGTSLELSSETCLSPTANPCYALEQETDFAVYTINTDGADTFLAVYKIHKVSHQTQQDIPSDEAAKLKAGKKEGEDFKAFEYLEVQEGKYVLFSSKDNPTENDALYIKRQHQVAMEKIKPLLETKVAELVKQKPELETELQAAEIEYSRTQLPPGM